MPYQADFERTAADPSNLYFGASCKAFAHLAAAKGYVVLGSTARHAPPPAMNDPAADLEAGGLPNPAEHYLPQLDGVRGLAIALVLMIHCQVRGPDPQLAGLTGGALIEQFLMFGWAGVELFFVLSGLLVTSILLRRKRLQQGLGAFYARRFARIVPAYLAVISAIAALSLFRIGPLVDPITAQARALFPYYALFLNNYLGWMGIAADEAERVLGPMWSVATEMQYYMLWPLVVMTFSERRLKQLLPLVLAISIAIRLHAIGGELPAKAIYVASLTNLDGIIAGSLLALYWDRLGQFARRYGLTGLALSLAGLVAYFWRAGTTGQYDPDVQTWGYTLVALTSSFLLMVVVSAPLAVRLFSLAPLRMLGRYSYFIYLIHMPILVLLDQVVVWQGLGRWLVYYGLVTIALVGIGALSWRYFEQPIIAWNQRRERGAGRER